MASDIMLFSPFYRHFPAAFLRIAIPRCSYVTASFSSSFIVCLFCGGQELLLSLWDIDLVMRAYMLSCKGTYIWNFPNFLPCTFCFHSTPTCFPMSFSSASFRHCLSKQLQQHFVQHLGGSGESSSASPVTIPSFTESKLILSREKRYWAYGPGDKVEGRLVLRNCEDLFCCGIRVDLEVIVSVKYREKEFKAFHSNVEDVLQPKVFTYVWPVNWSWVQISGKLTSEKLLCLPATKHSFPFSFQYPSKCVLPGSYGSPYGVVRHQVVAYIQTPCDFIQICSTTLKYKDYYNLALDPVALSPLTYEKQKRSLFHDLVRRSLSQKLSFTLRLPRQGFLPGDDSHFNLTLINQTGKRIERILVSFIQKVCYYADKNRKKTVGAVLDYTETTEADWAVETIWESSFHVPLGIKPTYRGIIEHLYFIKVQVYLKGTRRAVLKGHVPVIIGTTDNANDSGHGSSRGDTSSDQELFYTGHYSASHRRRSVDLPFQNGESSGKHRHKSAHAAGPPPPSYSQLPSRASSVDAFPPMYEDAMHNSHSAGAMGLATPSTSAIAGPSSMMAKPSTSSAGSSAPIPGPSSRC